ncbi:MAG: hypothetical protein ABI847_11215 [Anaerolineales bacterium]
MNLGGLIGLIIGLGAAVLAVGALALFFVRGGQAQKKLAARMAQAQPGAIARIVEVGSSSSSQSYGDLSVALRLEVTPAFGSAYQTISVWQIQPIHIPDVQLGKTLPVKVDAQNPKIIYPDVPWATQPDTTEFNEDDMTN